MAFKEDIRIPLSAPNRKFINDNGLKSQVSEFINLGPYLKGKYLDQFQMEFAKFIQVKYCVGVSSGTAALELAFRSLDLPSESKIGITANAGGYSSVAALRANLVPKYLEVDQSGLLDLNGVNSETLNDLKAIVATNLYGQSTDILLLKELIGTRNIYIIEDCAQSAGSVINGHRSGFYSDISTFSFYPTKNLSSFGDSGAICTNIEEIADRVKILREYGWTDRYFAEYPGGANYRMDDIHALTLSKQLQNLDANNSRRREIWNLYKNAISENDRMIGINDESFIAHLAVIASDNRAEFRKYFDAKGIDTGVHYPFPDYMQPAFKNFFEKKLKVTETLCSTVFSVPIFPEMSDVEVETVINAISSWYLDKSN